MAEYPLLGTVMAVPSNQRNRIFAAVLAGSTSTTEAAAPVPESPALHPEAGRWRWIPVLAGAAAVTVVGGLLLAGPAAAWSPNPDALTGTALQTAAERCLGSLSSLPIAPPAEPDLRVLGEARGSTEAVLIVSSSRIAFCVGTGSSLVTGSGVAGGNVASHALVVDGAPGGLNGADATRAVYGRIGTAVVTVRLETADHRHLTASAADGQFLAWWPSGADPVAVHGYDAAGHEVVTVHPQATSGDAQPQPSLSG